MTMSARQVLIADVRGFLLQKLEKDILNKLASDKKPAERTSLEHHKAGILKEVVNKAKEIAGKYSLALMPDNVADLKNNIVYVEWDSRELKYTFKNVIGEGSDAYLYEGVITKEQLPELAAVIAPLDAPSEIQHLCIDILTILSARKHIRFYHDDPGNHNKDKALELMLKERDREFDVWLSRMNNEGLAPADQYRIHKNYFKREFEKIEARKEGESDEDFESRAEKHFFAELKETAGFESTYRAVFQLYYRLTRQMFCLQQFAAVKDPEDLIAGADALQAKLHAEEKKTRGCDVDGLIEEHKIFERAFTNLIRHIKEMSEAEPFEEVPDQYGALSRLVALFNTEVNSLLETKIKLKDISSKAKAAAKSGDKNVLRQQKQEARAQIDAITTSKTNLHREISKYISLLHDQIRNFTKTKGLVEEQIAAIIPTIPDMVYLSQIAAFVRVNHEGGSEFDLLGKYEQELLKACQQQNGYMKENGWGTLGDSIHKEAEALIVKLQHYADIYISQQKKVGDAAYWLEKIKQWQEKIDKLRDKDGIVPELIKTGSTWHYLQAEFAIKWHKPFEDLIHDTQLNGFMAFMRRHWWKMLIGGVVLAAAAAPVAFFVLGVSLVAVAIAATVAFFAGVALGVGWGKAADRCCNVDEADDKSPRRRTSADIIDATHGSEADRAVIEMQERRRQAADDLPDIVIPFDQLDPDLETASRSRATSTTSTNPFDYMGEGVRKAPSPRSTNPFD